MSQTRVTKHYTSTLKRQHQNDLPKHSHILGRTAALLHQSVLSVVTTTGKHRGKWCWTGTCKPSVHHAWPTRLAWGNSQRCNNIRTQKGHIALKVKCYLLEAKQQATWHKNLQSKINISLAACTPSQCRGHPSNSEVAPVAAAIKEKKPAHLELKYQGLVLNSVLWGTSFFGNSAIEVAVLQRRKCYCTPLAHHDFCITLEFNFRNQAWFQMTGCHCYHGEFNRPNMQ